MPSGPAPGFGVDMCIKSWYGRLGNNVYQLRSCLSAALYYRGHASWPRSKKHNGVLRQDSIMFHNPDRGAESKGCHGEVFFGEFPVSGPTATEAWLVYAARVSAILRDLFSPALTADADEPSPDLAMHMRAGDVFRPGKDHLGYVQPPCAFYDFVLEDFLAEVGHDPKAASGPDALTRFADVDVRIVAENAANPCLSYVTARYPFVRWDRQSLAADVGLLLRAGRIAYGKGTFGPALAAAANASVAYLTSDAEDPASSGVEVRPLNVDAYVGQIWHMAGGWRPTAAQLELQRNWRPTAPEPGRDMAIREWLGGGLEVLLTQLRVALCVCLRLGVNLRVPEHPLLNATYIEVVAGRAPTEAVNRAGNDFMAAGRNLDLRLDEDLSAAALAPLHARAAAITRRVFKPAMEAAAAAPPLSVSKIVVFLDVGYCVLPASRPGGSARLCHAAPAPVAFFAGAIANATNPDPNPNPNPNPNLNPNPSPNANASAHLYVRHGAKSLLEAPLRRALPVGAQLHGGGNLAAVLSARRAVVGTEGLARELVPLMPHLEELYLPDTVQGDFDLKATMRTFGAQEYQAKYFATGDLTERHKLIESWA